jgi:predicted transcriptional regulator of viral defense system
MKKKDIALSLLGKNNGYLTAKMAQDNSVDAKTLWRMKEKNLIERVANGLYIGADIIPDRFYIAQYRCSKGIFSHLTALYLHRLSDRDPIRLTMTIPKGTSVTSFADENIIFHHIKPDKFNLGITETESMSGMKVKVYDIERTICDCLRHIDKMDNDLVLTGLKRYLQDKSLRNNFKLLEYASKFNMRDMIRRYMEVL